MFEHDRFELMDKMKSAVCTLPKPGPGRVIELYWLPILKYTEQMLKVNQPSSSRLETQPGHRCSGHQGKDELWTLAHRLDFMWIVEKLSTECTLT